jgi:hypothetical protein
MTLTEIEFELTPQQFEWMGYPQLQQGQALDVQLETSLLLPEAGGEAWFTVRPEALADRLVQVGRATYAFAGQITEADLQRQAEMESAALIVPCGGVPLRVLCAPQADGKLPYGTWETRYLVGTSRLYGVVEEDFSIGVGERVGVTLWSFRRLILGPGDSAFGEWYESTELLPTPYAFDRVVVTARVHRARV